MAIDAVNEYKNPNLKEWTPNYSQHSKMAIEAILAYKLEESKNSKKKIQKKKT